jgi:ribonucleoside-diphosphate reductase alpha chain/ribonucleoside-triphosphate reductase
VGRVLTDEFISEYDDKKPPMTNLGEFVYYRTYSRWLPEKMRREKWQETVRRAVEYNIGLDINTPLEELREEAQELYDNIFHLRQTVAGRTLWVGDTEVADKFPLANFNCAFLVLDDWQDFGELFYNLMVGTGVGFRVLPEDVEKIGEYRTGVEIDMVRYYPVDKENRKEFTSVEIDPDGVAEIVVGDSKEGWVKALDFYFEMITSHLYRGVNKIRFNFNNVRPKGERLKTFGGTASGHESIKKMFKKISIILARGEGELRPIHAMDIANIIGENVVVGGVRRTAEICLFDPDDEEILRSKDDIYTQNEEGEWVEDQAILHRRMSNNSILFKERPERERLHSILDSIKTMGEPGFLNWGAMKEIREDAQGVNPCGKEFCLM